MKYLQEYKKYVISDIQCYGKKDHKKLKTLFVKIRQKYL